MARITSSDESVSEPRPETKLKFYAIAAIVCLVLLATCGLIYYWRSGIKSEHVPSCGNAMESDAIVNIKLLANKTLVSYVGVSYPDGHIDEKNTFMECVCKLNRCIRKCCPPDQAMDMETARCAPRNYSTPFDPLQKQVYSDDGTLTPVNVSDGHFIIVYGEVCVEDRTLLEDDHESGVNYLLSNGMLKNKNDLYSKDRYCLDSFTDDPTIRAITCILLPEPNIYTTVYPIGEIFSLPFLLMTFLVYAILPDLQNLHGLSLMCHVGSLFFAYLCLSLNQQELWDVGELCVPLAFIVQFSFLASFFWLNVMCFDIWWVFSGLRPLRGSVKEREHKKFIIYSAYAWGWALAIFAVTLTMQTVKSIPDTYVKPEFGVGKCWFRTDAATFWYFYFPIIILVVLNIIMFVTTAFRIRAHTRETEVLNRGESRRHDENEKQRYNLYLKLFIVMGVNWVMELVSWIVGGEKELWYVTDIANTLQGVLIFLIFVWKRRILRLLNNKLCPSLQLVPTTSSTRSKVSPSRTTSSSLKQTPSNNINTAPDSVSLKKMNSNV